MDLETVTALEESQNEKKSKRKNWTLVDTFTSREEVETFFKYTQSHKSIQTHGGQKSKCNKCLRNYDLHKYEVAYRSCASNRCNLPNQTTKCPVSFKICHCFKTGKYFVETMSGVEHLNINDTDDTDRQIHSSYKQLIDQLLAEGRLSPKIILSIIAEENPFPDLPLPSLKKIQDYVNNTSKYRQNLNENSNELGPSLNDIIANAFKIVNAKKPRSDDLLDENLAPLSKRVKAETNEEPSKISTSTLEESLDLNGHSKKNEKSQTSIYSESEELTNDSIQEIEEKNLTKIKANSNGTKTEKQENSRNDLDSTYKMFFKDNFPIFKIDSIPSYESLKSLTIRQCRVRSIRMEDIYYMPNLQIFSFQGNYIRTLPKYFFKGMPALEQIILSHNKIKELNVHTFDGLFKLKVLKLANNKIKSLKTGIFKELYSIEEIDLSNNKIRLLYEKTFAHLSKLKKINFSNNKLIILEAKLFRGLISLVQVDFSNNRLEAINEKMFSTVENLEEVNFSNNHLESLDSKVFNFTPNLREVWFAENVITKLDKDLFKNCSKISTINFNYNRIIDLDEKIFANLSVLTRVYFKNNLMGNLDRKIFDSLTQLTEVDFRENLKELIDDSFRVLIKNVSTKLKFAF